MKKYKTRRKKRKFLNGIYVIIDVIYFKNINIPRKQKVFGREKFDTMMVVHGRFRL